MSVGLGVPSLFSSFFLICACSSTMQRDHKTLRNALILNVVENETEHPRFIREEKETRIKKRK